MPPREIGSKLESVIVRVVVHLSLVYVSVSGKSAEHLALIYLESFT